MIDLIIEPGLVKKRDQFIAENPPYSIALDGYVYGPPFDYPAGPWLNLNHHEKVDALATKCTSSQAYAHVMSDLFIDKFVKNGQPCAHVYANDPDQDVCLAYWILKNHESVRSSKITQMLERLTVAEDHLDSTAGAYHYDLNSNLMKDIAWIFEPYTSVRVDPTKGKLNAEEMKDIIFSVCNRIDLYLDGKGGKLTPNANYDEIERGDKWIMFHEIGPYARTKLFHEEGMKVFVIVKQISEDRFMYKFTKTQHIAFPTEQMYMDFNNFEGISNEENDKWSGRTNAGGSPRIRLSTISPKFVADYIRSKMC